MNIKNWKLYRPFEYLFYRIECLYDYTGVGGFYKHVGLAVSLFQMGNIIFIYSLLKDSCELNAEIYHLIGVYAFLTIFNFIYFGKKRINRIFKRYEDEKRKRKFMLGIAAFVYVLASIILFIESTNRI